jgi:hypothetical protein
MNIYVNPSAWIVYFAVFVLLILAFFLVAGLQEWRECGFTVGSLPAVVHIGPLQTASV